MHRNRFTMAQHIRRFRKRLDFNWAMRGVDVITTGLCCFAAGLLVGLGLLIITLGAK